MAITLVKKPAQYTPVDSPVIFELSSDKDNMLYFLVTVSDAQTSETIASQRYLVLPNLPNGTVFDLSSILSNYVQYELIVSDNLIEPSTKIFKSFYLTITEYYISDTNGFPDIGDTLFTTTFNVWNGAIDKLRYNNYSQNDYVISQSYNQTNFLTNKPDYSILYSTSSEYLNFLNDGTGKYVQFKTWDLSNNVTIYNKAITATAVSLRVDVSPQSLSDEFNVDLDELSYYSAQVVDKDYFGRTVAKYFKYSNECRRKPVELLFLNQLGGWDCVNFFNIRESLTIKNTNVTLYPYQFDSEGNYSNQNNHVYNSDVESIAINSTSTYTMHTGLLSDDESKWLRELFQSTKIYLKLDNGDFLPIQLTTTTYAVGQRLLNSSNIRLELSFTADGDVISAGEATNQAIPATAIMITAFSEFDYDTNVVYATTDYGDGKAFNATYESIKLNLGQDATQPDFVYMAHEDLGRIPTIKDTVMWLNWFSPSMRNPTTVRPFIQETTKLSLNNEWSCGGYTSSQVTVIPTDLKGGGSPNDQSFLNGARYLADLGYKVGIIPVISTADVTKTATDYLNWRGYIYFDNQSNFDSWNSEYQTFVKYYIDKCYEWEIDLGYIYVGSEFQCLLTADPTSSPDYIAYLAANPTYSVSSTLLNNIRNQFIQTLGNLGAYAKTKYPDATIVYASNWSEYGISNSKFNLDSLWINPNIDRIGIDWYFPLTETHTNSVRQIKNGITSGEYYDYDYVGLTASEYTLSGSSGHGKAGVIKVDIDPSQGLKNVQGFINNSHYVSPRGGYKCDASPLIIDENTYNSVYDYHSISGLTVATNIEFAPYTTVKDNIGGYYPPIAVTQSWISFGNIANDVAVAVLPGITASQSMDEFYCELDFMVTGGASEYDRVISINNLIDLQINNDDPAAPYLLYNIPGATGGSYFGFVGGILYDELINLKITITKAVHDILFYDVTTVLNGATTSNTMTAAGVDINTWLPDTQPSLGYPRGTVCLGAYNIWGYAQMIGHIYRAELSVQSNGEYYGGVFNFEDTYAGVRTEWDYFRQLGIPVKKVMATELGAGSFNGSSVNPNTFVTDDYSNTAPSTVQFPVGHNMKAWFENLENFNFFLHQLYGTYGSTFELDEDHQKIVLETQIKYLNSVGINEQVIYTLSSRYSGSFGTVFFNDSSGRFEIYTADTPIYPLSHNINGKKANGYNGGILNLIAPNIDLSDFTPLDYNPTPTTSMMIGSASVHYNSYATPDLTDQEWTFSAPSGNRVATATTDGNGYAVINGSKTATGATATGRFIRFYAYGDGVDKATRIPATISFEAKGDGDLDVIVYSSYDYSIVGRQQFGLTSSFSIFSFQPSRFYPNTEYILAIYVNGMLAGSNVTATFKKNLTLDLNTPMGLGDSYIRLRVDDTTLVGNAEPSTDWYGYDDHTLTAVKKYHQSSAFSKISFHTSATEGVIEYVRDFYNVAGKNIFNPFSTRNGTVLDGSGNAVTGAGAISGYIEVEQLTTYTKSAFSTTSPYYQWYDLNKNPLGSRTDFTSNTFKSPVGARYLVILLQNSSDDYTVYINGQIEKGTVATDFENYEGGTYCDISGLSVYVEDDFYKYISLEPHDTAKLIQQVKFDLPQGLNKKVTIKHNGRGAYAPFDPLVRRSGTYMRAVYLPDLDATINKDVKSHNLLAIGDSIISGFKISTNPQENVWMNAIANYGYTGDVFHQSYAGLILNTHIGSGASASAFATKMTLYPNVDKIFIQGGINDGGNNIPLANWESYYPDFIDKLHTAVPGATIYCFGFTPALFETNNIGVTYDQYRDAAKAVALARPSYCEWVDFRDIYTISSTDFTNIPDGIHPNDLGTMKLIQGMIDRTDIL